MSNKDLSSGDTSPLKGPAPVAQPEDISDIDKVDDAMPLTSPGDQPVQFIPQANNGDAKVDIPEGGTAPVFVGLGKDELMKYANDPFWVRLRWFLFILFWVLWVAMLAGAIIIIVLAPKCAEKKSHPEAYYELNLKNFAKDGKLADLGERAQYLSELGMTSVIISDVLKKDDNGGTIDFKDVDDEYGTITDFSNAVKKLKSAGLRVLLTFIPNHSGTNHEWFNDTENKEDYYIRKLTSDLFGTTWKQVDQNADAWTIDRNTSVKYLQQFSGNNADLNFRNEKVVDEIAGVIRFWKGKGVDAFVFPAASYLVEDFNRLREASATKNQPENVDVVKKILKKNPEDPQSIVEVNNLNEDDSKSYLESGIIPFSSETDLQTLDQYSLTKDKMKLFKNARNKSPSVIRLSGSGGRLQGQNRESADILRLLAYSSNASVILHYGDEIDGFDSKANTLDWETVSTNGSTFTFLKKLTELQKNFEDDHSKTAFKDYEDANNKNVVGFVRSARYATIINDGTPEATVDFSVKDLFDKEDAKAEVLITTPNVPQIKDGVVEKTVMLPPRSGVVLKLIQA